MTTDKRLTPKQRVLKKHPQAFASQGVWGWNWSVYSESFGIRLSECHQSARVAWAEAARKP